PRRRPELRPHARRIDDRAGYAVLFRKSSRWIDRGQVGARVRTAISVLYRDAALPRFAEPSRISGDGAAARGTISVDDRVCVRRYLITLMVTSTFATSPLILSVAVVN